jgi:hypothetical protein
MNMFFLNHRTTYITRTVYGDCVRCVKFGEFSDFLFLEALGMLEKSTFTAHE